MSPATGVALIETVGRVLDRKGHKVWSLPPEASVYDAISLMADKAVGAILVMERDEVVGIMSERDYARKVILQGKSSSATRIDEIMSSPVVTVTPAETIDICLRVMTERRIRHLPVRNDREVTGIVSIGDLVKAIIVTQAYTIDELRNYIMGKYPC
jgi:CBS domain-containing protein